jgi:hypothetical protein
VSSRFPLGKTVASIIAYENSPDNKAFPDFSIEKDLLFRKDADGGED